MKKMLKKVISMLIVICLMTGIANIPAYAKINTISAVKTTDVVLSKTYVTPAQALKKTVKSSAKATAKPTATKKTATKKPAAKAVSLTSQIISKYTKKGLTALKAVANKLGFSLKTTYEQFVRYGVTKKDMQKVSNTLINLVNRGVIFVNCVCLAVSKYLGISRNFSALQNLAADIADNGEWFGNYYANERVTIASSHARIVLQKNGYKNANNYTVKTKDFISNLKKGQKTLVYVDCYASNGRKLSGHEIMVQRGKDGKYSVCDILINGGNKITYTATEFKKLINGKSAKGKTSSGRTITKPVYLNSVSGYLRYKFIDTEGTMFVTTHSKNIAQAAFKITDAYQYAKKAISIADKLLKKKGTSSLAKTWLKKFKNLINNCINSSKSYLDKVSFLSDMYDTIQKIAEEKASILSLVKYSSYSKKNTIYHVVYPLRTVLKNNIVYKMYTKYGEDGVNLIQEFSKDYKLKEADVYNIFVKNKVTKKQIESHFDYIRNLMYSMANGFDVFNDSFGYDIYTDSVVKSSDRIKKTLKEIKQLLKK